MIMNKDTNVKNVYEEKKYLPDHIILTFLRKAFACL